jgi:sensor c-di-GMP phosphodiesterase-like protein
VEFAQGWLFSKPLPVSDFISFLCRSNQDGKADAVELEVVDATM